MNKVKELFFTVTILLFAFIFIHSVASLLTGETISGKATNQNVKLNVSVVVVSGPPALVLHNPKNHFYLTETNLLLNFTASGYQTIWFSLDYGQNKSLYTSPAFFNASQGSHVLQIFANNSYGMLVTKNVTFGVRAGELNCSYGKYQNTTFKGNSTDLYQFSKEEWNNLTNIILEDTRNGKIHFPGAINLTSGNSSINIDAFTNISFNYIEINTTALSFFNTSATLSIYDLTFANPRIVIDGNSCPSTICVIQSYTGGVLTFNVSHFTAFSAEEDTSTSSSSTSSSSSGGGSSSGTSEIKKEKEIKVVPESIQLKIKQGETKKIAINISNLGKESINISIEKKDPNKLIYVKEKAFALSPNEVKTVFIDILALEDAAPNTYFSSLEVSDEEKIRKIIPIVITINHKKALFDVNIEIQNKPKELLPGDNLLLSVKILDLGDIRKVDAKLFYEIKDTDGKIIMVDEEAIMIETQTEFIKNLNLPKSMLEGQYIVSLRVMYQEEPAVAGEWFIVIAPKTKNKFSLISIIIAALVIIVILNVLRKIIKRNNNIKKDK